jgi:hypothetical protein
MLAGMLGTSRDGNGEGGVMPVRVIANTAPGEGVMPRRVIRFAVTLASAV